MIFFTNSQCPQRWLIFLIMSNRIWAAYSRGRLLNALDYYGVLIRDGRLKRAGRLFESLRYPILKFLIF